jgi:hypothetical protein
MTSNRLGAAVLATVTLLSTLLTGSATAAVDHHRSYVLILTVRAPHGPSTTVRLQCHPPGGSHPKPRLACRAVASAAGDFDNLPGPAEPIFCNLIYQPVIASARGTWNGASVRWQKKFGNRCELHAKTDAVFDL